MDPFDDQETLTNEETITNEGNSELDDAGTLPSYSSTFTLCSPQPPSTTPALGITSANCIGSVTTVTFTFEIDSTVRPDSNTVAIGNGTGSPVGVFTLNVSASQTSGTYSYYTCVTVIQNSYANNSPFDITYTSLIKKPSPRTIRGTIICVGDPE